MKVRVLVVDDSAFMRNALANMLMSDPDIEVIGKAKDGLEAVAKVKTLKPDIVTLDVEMPRMDGLAALRIIMEENPLPVVMVSSLTTEDASITLEALEMGALDYISKNLADLSVNILNIKQVLIERIKRLARVKVARRRQPGSRPEQPPAPTYPLPPARTTGERRVGILSIGTSTGGPKALQEIIPALPEGFPVPIVIAQHMPANFTKPFAERLNTLSRVRVKEAEDGEVLAVGTAYIAPGRGNMRLRKVGAIETAVEINEGRGEYIYRPSVDALWETVAECYPGRSLCVILTGMGNDGLRGAGAVKQGGGRIFAQDEDSCIVYGMPKAIVDAGLADKVLALADLPGEIVNAI